MGWIWQQMVRMDCRKRWRDGRRPWNISRYHIPWRGQCVITVLGCSTEKVLGFKKSPVFLLQTSQFINSAVIRCKKELIKTLEKPTMGGSCELTNPPALLGSSWANGTPATTGFTRFVLVVSESSCYEYRPYYKLRPLRYQPLTTSSYHLISLDDM